MLFCYEAHDDVIHLHLRQFKSHNLTSIEEEMREPDSSKSDSPGKRPNIFAIFQFLVTVNINRIY